MFAKSRAQNSHGGSDREHYALRNYPIRTNWMFLLCLFLKMLNWAWCVLVPSLQKLHPTCRPLLVSMDLIRCGGLDNKTSGIRKMLLKIKKWFPLLLFHLDLHVRSRYAVMRWCLMSSYFTLHAFCSCSKNWVLKRKLPAGGAAPLSLSDDFILKNKTKKRVPEALTSMPLHIIDRKFRRWLGG